MDHEIENDVDVERTRCEDAEAVSLKEHGAGDARQAGGDGGVEALEMADGKDALQRVGEADEGVGFGEAGGQGFFDEDVEAGTQEIGGDGGVGDGGNTDAGRVKRKFGGEEIWDGGEGRDAEAGRQGFTFERVGFDQGGKCNGLAGSSEVGVDAQVVLAEGATTNDSDAEGRRRHDELLPGGRKDRRLDGFTAAAVELEKLRDLILGFAGGRHGEAGGGSRSAG